MWEQREGLAVAMAGPERNGDIINGRGLIIALISVGVALGGLILNGQHSTNHAIAELRDDIAGLRDRMSGLEQRMARLEGLFDGYTKREREP